MSRKRNGRGKAGMLSMVKQEPQEESFVQRKSSEEAETQTPSTLSLASLEDNLFGIFFTSQQSCNKF